MGLGMSRFTRMPLALRETVESMFRIEKWNHLSIFLSFAEIEGKQKTNFSPQFERGEIRRQTYSDVRKSKNYVKLLFLRTCTLILLRNKESSIPKGLFTWQDFCQKFLITGEDRWQKLYVWLDDLLKFWITFLNGKILRISNLICWNPLIIFNKKFEIFLKRKC